VPAAAAPAPAAGAVPELIRAKSILVVDDEPDVAQTLADMLELDGHRVEQAVNGVAALEKLRTGTYDLVLSDLRMPQLDGPGLYHEIEQTWPELCGRIVFVSGDALSGDIQAFFRRTGARSISKPFSVREVRRVVQAALGGA
jgi:CheY-like chemotaxis protein